MTVAEKLNLISQKQEALNQEIKNLKSEFENYITNTAVPLMTRWTIFTKAHLGIKNHDNYMPRFQSEGMNYIRETYLSELPKGHIVSLIEEFNTQWVTGETLNESSDVSMEYLIEAMEEILRLNLASYKVNW